MSVSYSSNPAISEPLSPDSVFISAYGHIDHLHGGCLLEWVSYFSGEPWSTDPSNVCPYLKSILGPMNDALRSGSRQLLRPFIRSLPGTQNPDLIPAREDLMTRWIVRDYLPYWLLAEGTDASPIMQMVGKRLREGDGYPRAGEWATIINLADISARAWEKAAGRTHTFVGPCSACQWSTVLYVVSLFAWDFPFSIPKNGRQMPPLSALEEGTDTSTLLILLRNLVWEATLLAVNGAIPVTAHIDCIDESMWGTIRSLGLNYAVRQEEHLLPSLLSTVQRMVEI